jgi:ferredoxin-type protein NapH
MSGVQAWRYLIARRAVQVGILLLFWLGAEFHLGVLTGNLSSSRLFRTVPLADPFAALQILAAGQMLAATALLGAGLVLAFYLVVGGRAFCAWVCPVNPLTDAVRWLKRTLAIRGQFRLEQSTRYWVATLALIVSAATGVAAFEALSPIGMLHRGLIFGPGVGLAAVGGLLLADLLVLRDGWCGSLCPLGAFYSLVGRGSLVRVGFDEQRCDRCGDCLRICPEPQVIHFADMARRGFIDAGNCLNCGRCLEVCPREAYRFALRLSPQRTGRV